jgi:hypothetical protein
MGEQNLFLEIDEEMGKVGGSDYRLYEGSRLWHSPEANPRSYYPDNVPVKYKWNDKTLTLIQPVETSTRMQKEIRLTPSISVSKIEGVYRIHNKNSMAYKIFAVGG